MNAYLHTLNPFALEIAEGIGIRWYGLAYLAGFLVGYFIIKAMTQRGLSPLRGEQVSDFVFTVALGTIIGGRLGYCIFYDPSLLTSFSTQLPFWGVLAINQGGMASHGGIIGIAVACLWFAKRHGISALHLQDLTTLGGTAGIFFGRIANFVNGELVGRVSPENYPLAVKFPQDILSWPSFEPGRVASLGPVAESVGTSAEQWSVIVKNFTVQSSAWQQLNVILQRIVEAVQDHNPLTENLLEPLLSPRYPSQLFEALLEGLALFIILSLIWTRPRKPGVIAGWFFSLYAIVRIIGEQYRMPDLHLGFQWLGLTRGQWLSVGMLIFGAVWTLLCSLKSGDKLGGWFRARSTPPA